MYKRRPLSRRVAQYLVLCPLLAASAWAQTASAPGVEKQFAMFHNELSGAADRLLADSAQLSRPANVIPAEPVPVAINVPGRLSSAVARVEQLRPLLDPILREEGVPTEIMAVVLVESGGRPTALSPKGALGIWQLMPETARRYGLTVTAEKDERLDVVKSTHVAARYLRDLYTQFGDWKLAFAAYNAGEQAVERAMQRVGSKDFLRVSAALPLETRDYVPAVYTAFKRLGAPRPTNSAGSHRQEAGELYANVQLEN